MNSCCFLFQKAPSNAAFVHSTPIMSNSKNPSHIQFLPITKDVNMGKIRTNNQKKVRALENSMSIDEDEELCPIDCVKEFYTDDEFLMILEKAKGKKFLVVVDFYRTSCASCKYIERGFGKLCRGAGNKEDAVIFLKHNVIDEYDEQSEVAERLRIKAVPLFQFYIDGVLLESFATRDKERILAAVQKYSSPS